jgi:hypothetical protein
MLRRGEDRMKWYKYDPDSDEFDWIMIPVDDQETVLDLHFDSKSVAASWNPIVVQARKSSGGLEDFPGLANCGHLPIFSQRAWDVMHPLIAYCCEALPIKHPSGKPFYIINVLDMIDCLDEERSVVKRFLDGRIMRVIQYHFMTGLLKGKHIFKTPLKSSADLLVSQVFRQWVEEHGLKGLLFRDLPMAK